MKSRRLLAVVLGTCLVVALDARLAPAQTTTGGAPATTIGGAPAATGGPGAATNNNAAQKTTSSSTTLTITASSSGNGTATGTPSTSNFLTPSMGDPFSMGLASKYTKGPPTTPTVTFGKANYTSTATSAAAGGAPATTTATNYGTPVGTVRNPQYSTVLSDSLPIVAHKSQAVYAEVRDALARSTSLQNKNAIQVSVNGTTVILTGQVRTDRERALAEGIVKMSSPSVRQVQNQLQVVQTK